MVAINALRQSVEKRVTDQKLRSELLGRIDELQRSVAQKQREIEELRSRLAAACPQGCPAVDPIYDYDPPV